MRIAYADPPYPRMARRYGRREVRWKQMVRALELFDGWALSCGSPHLQSILALCPSGCRVGAWVKTVDFGGGRFHPRYAWEPVIFKQARPSKGTALKDVVRCAPEHAGFFGSKPPEFCSWLFEILGAEPDDEFHDLFRGSGAVSRSWKQWSGGNSARVGGKLEPGDAPLFASANHPKKEMA